MYSFGAVLRHFATKPQAVNEGHDATAKVAEKNFATFVLTLGHLSNSINAVVSARIAVCNVGL